MAMLWYTATNTSNRIKNVKKFPKLTVQDLCKTNNVLKAIKDLLPLIAFRQSDKMIGTKYVSIFIDAVINISSQSEYEKPVYKVELSSNRKSLFPVYIIALIIQFETIAVCHSSYIVQISACRVGDDRGHLLKMPMQLDFSRLSITHVLRVHLEWLYDTLTTLHEGVEYRLRRTVQQIWDSLKYQDINV